MGFRWDQRIPEERPAPEPLSIWVYLVLYLIVEGVAVACVMVDRPKGVSVASEKFVHDALLVPFPFWTALCFLLYLLAYDVPATLAAAHNRLRWTQATRWQRQCRSGVAVVDSVVLAPEPDLAVRMLGLEGCPPENPGKVMVLDIARGEGSKLRLQAVLTQLLTPLLPRLATATESRSFDVVMQCDGAEFGDDVRDVWKQLELPGVPRVRWLDPGSNAGFAERWFEDDLQPAHRYASYKVDRTPKYRLLLAWHLHGEGADVLPAFSEGAVALLLGSPALMQEKKDLRQQAWLLREITGDADLVDSSLALLLDAGQVTRDRIRHFWHSRLKGVAQHGTMGALRGSGLKLDGHALDQAVGPQAPVARWLLQALAAKMAHFGQGPQLIALPHSDGVALNVVAKEPAPVDVPWKEEYAHDPLLGPELGVLVSVWAFEMLVSPNREWGGFETVVTSVVVVLMVAFFVARHPGRVSRMAESAMDFVASMIPW
jgi:hypothetical protein